MGVLSPKYHSDQLRVPGEPDGSPVRSISEAGFMSGPMNEVVDILKFHQDGFRQHEGIEIRLAHAAVDTVDGDCQRNPCIDQGSDAVHSIGVEIDFHGQILFIDDRTGAQAERVGRFRASTIWM